LYAFLYAAAEARRSDADRHPTWRTSRTTAPEQQQRRLYRLWCDRQENRKDVVNTLYMESYSAFVCCD